MSSPWKKTATLVAGAGFITLVLMGLIAHDKQGEKRT